MQFLSLSPASVDAPFVFARLLYLILRLSLFLSRDAPADARFPAFISPPLISKNLKPLLKLLEITVFLLNIF